jgi:hypothetical protein
MQGFHYATELYPVYGQAAVNTTFQRCIACAGQTYSMYDGTGRRIGEGRQSPSPTTTAIPERNWNVFIENVRMISGHHR